MLQAVVQQNLQNPAILQKNPAGSVQEQDQEHWPKVLFLTEADDPVWTEADYRSFIFEEV